MLDQAMEVLGDELVDWYAKWNPIYATYIGIHDYDNLLPDSSYSALKDEIEKFRDFKARIEAVNPRGLSPDKKIDRRFLIYAIDLQLFDEEVLRRSECFPAAPSDFGTSIMLPFMRDYAPLPQRLRSISARFAAAPKFLDDAKDRLKTPVKLWAQIGAESCQRLQGLLKTVERTAMGNLPHADVEALAEASAKAAHALNEHENWLRDTVVPKASDTLGIGARNFSRLLKLRRLGISRKDIYELGQRYLASSKKQMKKLAQQTRPGSSVDQVKEAIQSDHPKDFAETLSSTVKAMNEAKRFVQEKGIVTIPENEQLKVIETPDYLRHVMPIAAYSPSAKFEKTQQGIYIVTPFEKNAEELKKHSYASIWNTAVHEAYPGHHLHNTCAHANPSKARAFVWAAETVEGWAHYCEDMMKEYGFHADPETMFMQTMDIAWRACRVIIDNDLHSGKMTFDQAVDMLVKEAGMDKAGATAEVKRYTYNPGYQLSYLIGKHLIVDLRERVKKRLGPKYTDRFFHDTFVSAGLLPIDLINEVFEQRIKEIEKA